MRLLYYFQALNSNVGLYSNTTFKTKIYCMSVMYVYTVLAVESRLLPHISIKSICIGMIKFFPSWIFLRIYFFHCFYIFTKFCQYHEILNNCHTMRGLASDTKPDLVHHFLWEMPVKTRYMTVNVWFCLFLWTFPFWIFSVFFLIVLLDIAYNLLRQTRVSNNHISYQKLSLYPCLYLEVWDTISTGGTQTVNN